MVLCQKIIKNYSFSGQGTRLLQKQFLSVFESSSLLRSVAAVGRREAIHESRLPRTEKISDERCELIFFLSFNEIPNENCWFFFNNISRFLNESRFMKRLFKFHLHNYLAILLSLISFIFFNLFSQPHNIRFSK